MYFNLRCLFNILYTKHTEESVVISLNAQHAFDPVKWPYMMFTLQKFGFGSSFMKWIEIIYSYPAASIITNQNISRPFAIHCGTRQACALDLFLFSVIIEPLSASIRQNSQISPIDMNADDILLYVSNMQASIPLLLTLTDNLGSLLGFQLSTGT